MQDNRTLPERQEDSMMKAEYQIIEDWQNGGIAYNDTIKEWVHTGPIMHAEFEHWGQGAVPKAS